MEVATKRGLKMIDAPVSGGVGGADAGTLTFMCGGEIEAYNKAEPILKSMGKNIFHAGKAGSGQAAKVCNNLMLAIQMIAVSEGFLLAEKLDLDAQKLWDIASTATSKCWSMTDYCPVPGPVPTSPANKDYTAGFTVAMMLKDLNLSQEAALDNGLNTPLGAKATELYNTFSKSENNLDLDFSAIIKQIRNIR
jgi:3-hydroxyisobutyrate dehydrogenase